MIPALIDVDRLLERAAATVRAPCPACPEWVELPTGRPRFSGDSDEGQVTAFVGVDLRPFVEHVATHPPAPPEPEPVVLEPPNLEE